MKTFSVVIKETNFKNAVVKAKDKAQAKEIAREMYEQGQIIFDGSLDEDSYITVDVN